jgi:all-trans-retinol 13,14-reductase
MKRLKHLREAGDVIAMSRGSVCRPTSSSTTAGSTNGLNESKPYLGSLCGIDRYDNWAGLGVDEKRMRKQRWTDRLIADLDTHCRDIAAAIVHREMATAETMQRYLNTPGGAVYGFAPDDHLGDIGKFTPRTSLQGLWLASAYTFGGGFSFSMLGGAAAARAAMAA